MRPLTWQDVAAIAVVALGSVAIIISKSPEIGVFVVTMQSILPSILQRTSNTTNPPQ